MKLAAALSSFTASFTLASVTLAITALMTIGAAGAVAETAPRPELESLMTQLAQRREGHVAYEEEHYIGSLTRPLHSSGELLYVAPGHLEKRSLQPKSETLVVDGGTITEHRGSHTHVLALEDYPQVVPLIEGIRATLAGDLPALERLFTITFSGSSAQWRLTLVPVAPRVAQTVQEIDIGGAGTRLQTIEIRQSDGDRSLLTLGADLPQ